MISGDPFSFPASLLGSIRSVCTIDEQAFLAAHEKEVPVSVRINPLKPTGQFNHLPKVPWCGAAYYLPERISFIRDPLFHAGSYYVQEASSMFVEHVIRQSTDLSKDLRVLDLCASPGGKSTLINSLLSPNSLLVSNEVIKTRVGALAENMSKWGHANVIVSNNDPKDFTGMQAYFDLMVVDAPCSGSGLFRKQQDAIDHWSEENVVHCSQRQERILADVLPALNAGGVLIYSTCSYSPEENERMAQWLVEDCGLENIRVQLPDAPVVETQTGKGIYGYRFFPHLTSGEGFFLAAFRKTSGDTSDAYSKKYASDKMQKGEEEIISSYVGMHPSLRIVKQKEHFFLLNSAIEEELDYLSQHLYIRKKGTLLGEIKGKDFVPHHELALSAFISKDVAHAEVNEETALKFLKKADFRLGDEYPKGFCLIRYKGHGIGWVKNIGNRVNNYLPKEWRILMDLGS
jgi:16S rRNA C967 or C1407 C5-methylase (RsmB/RsmF family)/NOL1/NOP2/fmu family ribosome biogenesis protein